MKSVTVLMGGWSSEREVSLNSGAAVVAALREAGFAVRAVDLARGLAAFEAALDPRPDVVFNALHGSFGEDGRIQGLLDVLAIPYTHSGVLASAMAMDKAVARRLFAASGIPVAVGRVVSAAELAAGDPMPRPYVVKPINEGSSVGVQIVMADSPHPVATAPEMLVEEFVPGREITVAVMGERALGALEITSDRGFYDYTAKYAPGGSRHLMPAPLPEADYALALRLSIEAHRALGCRGVSRTDLRYDDTGPAPRMVVLEVNTQPGMTGTSLVPDIAAWCGISFPELVTWMVENAKCDA
ncbi:MAG: D-alanine--D-alanine ligase [Alphaproteobacteria bacterium]|nr:D-alanine--D-alanine ligase [Alphaproteobacteria bacterium]